MTRWTFRILICLLLGVVTTVGVAWGLARAMSIDIEDLRVAGRTDFGLADWYVYDAARPGRRYIVAAPLRPDEQSHPLLSAADTDTLPGVFLPEGLPQPDGLHRRLYTAAGFPCLALNCLADRLLDGSLNEHGALALWSEDVVDYSKFDHDLQAVPLRPILPGFLINTLFYAAIWLGLFFGLAATRRTIRRRHGRCVKCGYDLRGAFLPSPAGRGAGGEDERGCPECGWGRMGGMDAAGE